MRTQHCTKCGKEGHNRLSCGKPNGFSSTQGFSAPNLMPDTPPIRDLDNNVAPGFATTETKTSRPSLQRKMETSFETVEEKANREREEFFAEYDDNPEDRPVYPPTNEEEHAALLVYVLDNYDEFEEGDFYRDGNSFEISDNGAIIEAIHRGYVVYGPQYVDIPETRYGPAEYNREEWLVQDPKMALDQALSAVADPTATDW